MILWALPRFWHSSVSQSHPAAVLSLAWTQPSSMEPWFLSVDQGLGTKIWVLDELVATARPWF